jgi:hypothetical protein
MAGMRFLRLCGLVVLVGVFTAVAAASAQAAATLTVTGITWNVIGLDSNKVTSGPNQFPVGMRVCNGGASAATNTTATFTWDSANQYISLLESPTIAIGTLAAGGCSDVYWTAVVARDSAAYDTTRQYHVTVSADSTASVSTPTPRELYVEHLVSQNRNSLTNITGPASVRVGTRITEVLNASTATNGYEQLTAASLWPTSMFRVVSTSTTYTAPAGGTNDKLYADACGWDPVPTSPTYNSCVGPAGISGGKAGGTIQTTYVLDVIGAGSTTVNTEVYDFSGSSFHYNSDYSTNVFSITATNDPAPTATNDSASTSPSTPVTIDVLANDSDSDGDTLTITGSTAPAHGTVTCTATQCQYTPANGFTGTDSFQYTISDGHGGTATATVSVTVSAVVPAFGVDSPLPVILLAVGLGALLGRRLRRPHAS